MREIHEIRERLSQEAKGLTPEERTERVKTEARELLDRYGIQAKIVTAPERRQQMRQSA